MSVPFTKRGSTVMRLWSRSHGIRSSSRRQQHGADSFTCRGLLHLRVQLHVNKCWPRRQTTNNPLPPLLHTHTSTQLTDGLSSDYKSAAGPKGILGSERGGLVRVWLTVVGWGGLRGCTVETQRESQQQPVTRLWMLGGPQRAEKGGDGGSRNRLGVFVLLYTEEVVAWTWPPDNWAVVSHSATSCQVCVFFYLKASVASSVPVIWR